MIDFSLNSKYLIFLSILNNFIFKDIEQFVKIKFKTICHEFYSLNGDYHYLIIWIIILLIFYNSKNKRQKIYKY